MAGNIFKFAKVEGYGLNTGCKTGFLRPLPFQERRDEKGMTRWRNFFWA